MAMNRGIMDLSNMAYNPPRREKLCTVCGVLYIPNSGPQTRCNGCRLITNNCLQCNKKFKHVIRQRMDGYRDGGYCSLRCRVEATKKNPILANCSRCGKEYQNYPSRIDKFCSRKCYWKSLEGIHPKALPKYDKGHTPWNKGLKGFNAGEKSPSWKGGITPINEKLRRTIDYKNWRKAVYERDNFTCQECG